MLEVINDGKDLREKNLTPELCLKEENLGLQQLPRGRRSMSSHPGMDTEGQTHLGRQSKFLLITTY